MIHVYTGDGKGKTTAALGMALRAAGHGLHTLVIQFLKGLKGYGELTALKSLGSRVSFAQFGRSCPFEASATSPARSSRKSARKGAKRPRKTSTPPALTCATCSAPCHVTPENITPDDRARVKSAFDTGLAAIESRKWDIVVLDEVLCLVPLGLAAPHELVALAEKWFVTRSGRKKKTHALVFTGWPRCPDIERVADLVTCAKSHKHHSRTGLLSVPGVDR